MLQGYRPFSGLGLDRDFSVTTGVFLVMIEFVSCWFYVSIRALLMLQQCFLLCCDDVAAKTAKVRGQGATEAWLRPRNFGLRQ